MAEETRVATAAGLDSTLVRPGLHPLAETLTWPKSRVLALAPAYWQETLKQDETQQRLAANVFHRIALGEHPADL